MSGFDRAADTPADGSAESAARPATLDLAWLAAHPLPAVDPEGDKEGRGHVLVVGGSAEIPGAVILAATAALRAGAGKLSVLTEPSSAPWIASAVPESRTIAADGGWAKALGLVLKERAGHAGLLIGPGMETDAAVADAVEKAIDAAPELPIVLDAAAVCTLRRPLPADVRVVVTPHAGELARLLGWEKQRIVDDPVAAAHRAAERWRIDVLLKGATTVYATAAGTRWRFHSQTPGLGTSGSGDVLAGVLAALLGRGAEPVVAAAWAVVAHCRCGQLLEQEHGEVGYLAREMADRVPRALRALSEQIAAERR